MTPEEIEKQWHYHFGTREAKAVLAAEGFGGAPDNGCLTRLVDLRQLLKRAITPDEYQMCVESFVVEVQDPALRVWLTNPPQGGLSDVSRWLEGIMDATIHELRKASC